MGDSAANDDQVQLWRQVVEQKSDASVDWLRADQTADYAPTGDRVHHLGRNAALQRQPASQPHGHEDGNCGEDAVPAELKWAQLGNHRIEANVSVISDHHMGKMR